MLDAKGRADNSAVLIRDADQTTSAENRAEPTNKALDHVREAIKVCGSNQKEVVRKQFYALYPGNQDAKQKAFLRGWSLYMNLVVSDS